MASEYQVKGKNSSAPFTLRVHRGDGMALLAMNWRHGQPPPEFVGFAIEFQEPGSTTWKAVRNRLTFPGVDLKADPAAARSTRSPIQKFRWVHFPFHADAPGQFTYRVTPMFFDGQFPLRKGSAQTAKIELARDTYPGQMNVTFTRGFVSSQAFVDEFAEDGDTTTLLPAKAADGLKFQPTNPKAPQALAWMGFEARSAIIELLEAAVAAPQATVSVVAYDLSEPEVVDRLVQLGSRLRIIIDNSADHGDTGSGESQAATKLRKSAGAANVKRQHMGQLQHNKTIIVDGPGVQQVVCGSTNFSWRGFYVQNNNAVVLTGADAIAPFQAAFEQYWRSSQAAAFGASAAAEWVSLGLADVDAQVAFSPHSAANSVLAGIATDVDSTESSLFYSLAFLSQTGGPIRTSITKAHARNDIFVFGMADKKVGGIELATPDGNLAPVSPAALTGKVPEPFKSEPSCGGGIHLHHKFVVIDFDQPTARVYLGSYNFSGPADNANGENLLLIRDRKVAVSYMVEAVRIFDHYQFRLKQKDAKSAKQSLQLALPPAAGAEAWWQRDWDEPHRVRDRLLFA